MREWDVSTGERGLRLRTCEWGRETGRPTVILHGWLEQAAAWDEVASQLPGRVLALDHRGHGLSEHIGKGGFYHFWDYVSDLDRWLDQVRPDGPVDVIGHSMGGTLACLFAALRPQKVDRLVLIEGVGPPDFGLSPRERALQFLEHQRQPPQHKPMKSVEEGVARMRVNNPSIREEIARKLVQRMTRALPDGTLVWTWDPIHRSRSPQPFLEDQFIAHLHQIEAPTWLIYGGDSPYTKLSFEHREQAIPNVQERVLIPGAGHLLHHDQPTVLADHLQRILEAR